MGRLLQRLEGIDVQRVVNAFRKPRPDTRNGLKQLLRFQRTAQARELTHAAGPQDLFDGRGDTAPDIWQRHKALDTVAFNDVAEILW